jgi:hypothetical protein
LRSRLPPDGGGEKAQDVPPLPESAFT